MLDEYKQEIDGTLNKKSKEEEERNILISDSVQISPPNSPIFLNQSISSRSGIFLFEMSFIFNQGNGQTIQPKNFFISMDCYSKIFLV